MCVILVFIRSFLSLETDDWSMKYAGTYVPYIANHIYNNPSELDLNLKGFWISDRTSKFLFVYFSGRADTVTPFPSFGSLVELGCCAGTDTGR